MGQPQHPPLRLAARSLQQQGHSKAVAAQHGWEAHICVPPLSSWQVLHSSLKTFRPITVRLLNYRADGTPFVNDLTVMPIVDRATNTTSHFLGILRERRIPDPQPQQHAALKQPMSETAAAAAAPRSAQPRVAVNGHPSAPSGLHAAAATGEGDPAASTSTNSGQGPIHIPTQLQEALQFDVPYPQLITERTPPYKTIHVNAAWCRQCGYRADDLIGRPYSLLLGPRPASSLIELLEQSFVSGRAVTCHAVYFTKSGLPWQAELTLSPLLDTSGTSSTYFVHLLRPSAETPAAAFNVADAEPRVQSGHASGSKSSPQSSAPNAGSPNPLFAPTGGHSVISLSGLPSVPGGHKGLAAHFTLPGTTVLHDILHDQQRLQEAALRKGGATAVVSGKKRAHEASAAAAPEASSATAAADSAASGAAADGTGAVASADAAASKSADAVSAVAPSEVAASSVGTGTTKPAKPSGEASGGKRRREAIAPSAANALGSQTLAKASRSLGLPGVLGEGSMSGISSLENASPSNDGSEYEGENGLLAQPGGQSSGGQSSPDNGDDDGAEDEAGSGSGDSGSGESGSGGSGSGSGSEKPGSHGSSLSTATTKDAPQNGNDSPPTDPPAHGKASKPSSKPSKASKGATSTGASTRVAPAKAPPAVAPAKGPGSHSSSGGSLEGLNTSASAITVLPPATSSTGPPPAAATAAALASALAAPLPRGSCGGGGASQYNEILMAQYALAAEAVAKMAGSAGMGGGLPPALANAAFNPAAALGLPAGLPPGLAAGFPAGLPPTLPNAAATAAAAQQLAAGLSPAMPPGYPALNVLAATNPGLNASLLSALSATSPFDAATAAAGGAPTSGPQMQIGAHEAQMRAAASQMSQAAMVAKTSGPALVSAPHHPSPSFATPSSFSAAAAANVLISQHAAASEGMNAAHRVQMQGGTLPKLSTSYGHPAAALDAGSAAARSSFSSAVSSSGHTNQGGSVRVPPFLTKLYTIMQDAQPDDCAGWCPDGSAFRITDPQRFADRCLPRFFKHNKLGSFQQQLLTYGFSRVPNESCLDISAIWQHPKFIAGRPELLELITRATTKPKSEVKEVKEIKDTLGSVCGRSIAKGGSDDGENGPAATEGDDKAEEFAGMQSHLARLSSSLTEMHHELRAARSYEMHVLEELVRKVDKRLGRGRAASAASSTGSGPSAASATGSASASATGSSSEGIWDGGLGSGMVPVLVPAAAVVVEQADAGAAALAALGAAATGNGD